MSFVYVISYFPFGFEGNIRDLVVSIPDHCLSFYFREGVRERNCMKLLFTQFIQYTVAISTRGNGLFQHLELVTSPGNCWSDSLLNASIITKPKLEDKLVDAISAQMVL